MNPVNFNLHKSVCKLKNKVKNITRLEPTTPVITGQRLNHSAADVNIYVLA